MNKVTLRSKAQKRKLRVRKKVYGTPERPRLSVFRSNKYCYAQIIDDTVGKTLASVSFKDIAKLHSASNKSDAAFELGKLIAKDAKKNKIDTVVFDRNGYKYQGRVKSIAEGAREGGLNF